MSSHSMPAEVRPHFQVDTIASLLEELELILGSTSELPNQIREAVLNRELIEHEANVRRRLRPKRVVAKNRQNSPEGSRAWLLD